MYLCTNNNGMDLSMPTLGVLVTVCFLVKYTTPVIKYYTLSHFENGCDDILTLVLERGVAKNLKQFSPRCSKTRS